MTRPIRVAHVVLSLDLGGLERLVLGLLREARAAGRQADVVCLERPGRLAGDAKALGARVVCVGKAPGVRPSTTWGLRAAFAELRPDVVHTHQLGALLYAGLATRAPILHTEHGKADGDSFRRRALGRLASRFAGRFVCVSRDIADEVRARRVAPPRRLRVIPNGIDLARPAPAGARVRFRAELGIPQGAPVVGTVARLDGIKRLDLLVRSFRALREANPDVHLLVVGDGPERAALEELAADLGLAGVAHFPGYRADPERSLAAMDVFALTSRSEGMPLSVLEAWAAGLPVASVRVGGLPEFIDDGRNGVFARSDDPESIAAALAGLLRDPRHARRIGEAGRATVNASFSLRRMAQQYDREYEALLGVSR